MALRELHFNTTEHMNATNTILPVAVPSLRDVSRTTDNALARVPLSKLRVTLTLPAPSDTE